MNPNRSKGAFPHPLVAERNTDGGPTTQAPAGLDQNTCTRGPIVIQNLGPIELQGCNRPVWIDLSRGARDNFAAD